MTRIPEWQRKVHIVSEAAALAFVPLILAAARDAREPHQSRLKILAIGTLLVDGLLLLRWATRG